LRNYTVISIVYTADTIRRRKSERKITFTRKELQNEIHWNFILNFFQVLFVPPFGGGMERIMSNEYGADQIQILEGLEAVRKRPGMYIGSTSSKGLHHLVYEIVDNAVDEALSGYCDTIDVTINEDNSITVIDNGRGIPVGINQKKGISSVEVVFTILHAGGKFGGGGYKVSGGLHGVGASVVNALSEWLTVEICVDGKKYFQRYERGKAIGRLEEIGVTDCRGTTVSFLPDKEIFEETIFDYEVLKQRLREMAFLTKNLKIILRDKRGSETVEREFHYAGGIKEYVEYLNHHKDPLYPDIIYCEGTRDNVYVEVAMQHNSTYTEGCYSFVNNITTPEGGTHLAGFKNAITKTFNDYARSMKYLKDSDQNLTGEDIREGLTAIISIKISEPQFEGQTKQKLGNSEARGAVDGIVSEQLTYFLEQNPQVARLISEKSVLAQRARDAARKARDLTRRKTALEGTSFPVNLQIVPIRTLQNVKYILLREILRVVQQKQQEREQRRLFFPYVVKYLMLRNQDLIRFLSTMK
jgi:DNA gyrase subunit B